MNGLVEDAIDGVALGAESATEAGGVAEEDGVASRWTGRPEEDSPSVGCSPRMARRRATSVAPRRRRSRGQWGDGAVKVRKNIWLT